ncbi:hypothetical protein VI06_19885 [Aquitalea magnusonii]|nr:hypothetical protein VI06_19885 [Aquitalea magnusonii]
MGGCFPSRLVKCFGLVLLAVLEWQIRVIFLLGLLLRYLYLVMFPSVRSGFVHLWMAHVLLFMMVAITMTLMFLL